MRKILPSPLCSVKNGLLGLLGLVASLLLLDWIFPPPLEAFRKERAQASRIVLAADGSPLRAFADARGVWRYPITPEQTSQTYLRVLLNYEDRWFFRHPGVNPLAMFRAFGQSLRRGRVVSGGSTITMQVARMIEPIPRTISGKFKQIVRALQLEKRLTKKEILELYLTHAPFGGPIEGVEAASYAYLGRSSQTLSDAEAALLVVLPQRPSALRPDRYPDRAQKARNKVLLRMQHFGILSAANVQDAMIETVVARRFQAPMLAALLAERLKQSSAKTGERGSELSALAPLRLETGIDPNWQKMAENRLTQALNRLPPQTSAAALIVDNTTMLAKVYVGSGRFGDEKSLGHIDMVRALRSPGSTLKPSLYGLALDAGLIHSESLLLDAPQNFSGYRPSNFSENFNGPISAASALRLSLNVPAVDLIDRLGPGRFYATLKNAGLNLQLPPNAVPNLSLILGGAGTSLEELVGLQAALSRGGLAARVRLQTSEPLQDRRLLSPGAAWIVYQMLAANPRSDHSPLFANGRTPIAYKTGTSFGFRDAWALGSTQNLTIGVWLGRPDGTPMPGSYGAATALPLLFELFDALPNSALGVNLTRPSSVQEAAICWPTGQLQSELATNLCHVKKEAWILEQAVPPTFAERDLRLWQNDVLSYFVDAKTGARRNASCLQNRDVATVQTARWPALSYPWLSARLLKLATLPALASDCLPDGLIQTPLVLDGVVEGATLKAPSNRDSTLVGIRALGSETPVRWLLNDRFLGDSENGAQLQFPMPAPGTYRLLAQSEDGRWGSVNFIVVP